jgi:hypothetical protein
MRLRWVHLLDAGIILVLVGGLVAAGLAWHREHSHDGDARAVAAWMHDHHEQRVAWPTSLRSSVPALLAAGVTPVLVDDNTPVQDYAVNDTPVVVSSSPKTVVGSTTRTFKEGSLTVHLLDAKTAAATTLAAGQSVGQEFSRPYRFSPFLPSRQVSSEHPLVVHLSLRPGLYQLTVDAFDPTVRNDLVLTVGPPEPIVRSKTKLAVIVMNPAVLDFNVGATHSGTTAVPVTLTISATGPTSPATALVNGWQLECLIPKSPTGST